MKKLRIGIIDDHSLLRKGIISLIETTSDMYSLFDCENGYQALNTISKGLIPDIIIIDINIPFKNGFEITKDILKKYPRIRIIGFSMFDDEFSIIEMIKSGARGYLSKTCLPSEILDAIRIVGNGETYFPPNITSQIVDSIFNSKFENKNNLIISLNQQERKFLKHLCEELTYTEIADKMCLSSRTIDDYRLKLCKKLKVKGKTGLVVFAIKNLKYL